jgi:hypothetical protein
MRAVLSRGSVQAALATFAYLAFAAYLTWPLITDLDTRIFGAVGDLTGAMATHRELAESGQFPFSPGTLPDFSAPDGLEVRWTLNLVTLPSFGILHVLTLLFGPIAAAGVYVLAGFTLTGLATFLLVRRLVGHGGVAFVAGFAYAFYPFVVVKAQGHVDYVHGWVLVLLAWRLLELLETPTRRNGLWAGLALVLTFAWTPYHIVFGAVMAVAVGAVALIHSWKAGRLRESAVALAIACAIGLAWPVGMALVNTAAPHSQIRTHTIDEAVAFSARAEEYVVPTSQQPFFGERAGRYRTSHMHGSNPSENTLYVGISILALALVGLIAGLRAGGTRRRLALAGAAVAVAGFATSAPPEVTLFGESVPTTTHILFDITSTWRVFSRLVVVVMLGLVLLAALGLATLVRRRSAWAGALVIPVALGIVAADLWARADEPTNRIVAPNTYERLAQLPRGIAVEYPLLPAEQSIYGDVFYQAWHDQPILNGYYVGAEENRALRMTDLSDPRTADGLQALGVRYVLVRRDLKAAGLPNPGRPGRAFRFVTEDPYIALYVLRHRGPNVLVTPGDGFGPPEVGVEGRSHWLLERDGTLKLRGSCAPCVGTVALTVGSFAGARQVTVRGSAGRVLAAARVSEPQRLRFPLRFDREAELKIEAEPGPRSISEATDSADPRSVSISVGGTSFKFRQPRSGAPR